MNVPKANLAQWHGFRCRAAFASASAVGLFWYLAAATHWQPLECLQFTAGALALWLPFGAAIFLLVRKAFSGALSCFVFSWIASYALTTLAYFACSACGLLLPGFEAVFYVVQAGAISAALLHARRQGLLTLRRAWPLKAAHIDWPLVMLLVLSLLATTRYKQPFEYRPDEGVYRLITSGDQTYYSAIAYELDRHTPALQQATRAGVADRAYHVFPHLTTMLLARYTGQRDMLRAHLAYEYSVLELMLGLALYSITKSVTASRWASYAAVALLYLFAIPLPNLVPESSERFFYCALWPHATSSVEPVLITSPQSYPGIAVLYGVYLGALAAASRLEKKAAAGPLVFVLAAMAGAMARFRIQLFLPLLPAFLLLMIYFWLKTRQRTFVAAGLLAIAVSALLILEMRSAIYLPGSSSLLFGNSRLSEYGPSFLRSWPGAAHVEEMLAGAFSRDSALFAWTWQIACLAMFTLVNILGLPLLVAVIMFIGNDRTRGRGASLVAFAGLQSAASLLGATCISATYDFWSVGGQMLLQIGWQWFPFIGGGLWAMSRRLPSSWRKPLGIWSLSAWCAVALGCFWQSVRTDSLLQQFEKKKGVATSPDDMQALRYIRSDLPSDAVILSNNSHGDYTAFFSGIAGKRAYLEYVNGTLRKWDDGSDSDAFRINQILAVWHAATAEDFHRSLPPMVTHLVEYVESPLKTRPSCLKLKWVSPRRTVAIWEVRRSQE